MPSNHERARQQAALRSAVLQGYGALCVCCDEDDERFLTIDHKNGGGHQERKKLSRKTFYKRIIAAGFPSEYQVLCFNCNCASAIHNGCPHKQPICKWPKKI